MAKRKSVNQRKASSASQKRRKADQVQAKPVLSALESLENDLIDVGEMDVEKLILAGKSIFDSARRCLKGGKKRRVIQSDNRDNENAGVGWKVNFRTIMKHIRERNALDVNEEDLNDTKTKIALLKAHIENNIPEINDAPASVKEIMDSLTKDNEEDKGSKSGSVDDSKFALSESTIRKIWDSMSFSRCFPVNDTEMKELKGLEINKYIHYSLPKNEWYFGKFWFNKSRDDIISELKHRQNGRQVNSINQSIESDVSGNKDKEEDMKRESLAVLADLKQQILNSGIKSITS